MCAKLWNNPCSFITVSRWSKVGAGHPRAIHFVMLMALALHDWLWALWGARAQEEAEFRELAARPNVLDLIPKRIAPQIFGSDRIKEAVACLLFGGSRKVRGAAHLLRLSTLDTKDFFFPGI